MTDNKNYSKPPMYDAAVSNYLGMLRKTGATNMCGAGPYLERDFGMTRHEAKDCLMHWMSKVKE